MAKLDSSLLKLLQRAEAFLHAPRYEGAVFVAVKRWVAELDNRPAGTRRRDKLQADIVQQLLDERALQP